LTAPYEEKRSRVYTSIGSEKRNLMNRTKKHSVPEAGE
jgi:hypothetical protein